MKHLAVKGDVDVVIEVQRPTPKLGFGKPLIVGSSTAGQAYKNYADLEAVKADFDEKTEVFKAARAIFLQDNAPAEIAIMCRKTDATPQPLSEVMTEAFKRDWYFVVPTSELVADITAIADAVEQDGTRQFIACSGKKTDLGAIKKKGYKRTTIFYHTDPSSYPDAAMVGAVGSLDVGSVTWKFKKLNGIVPLDIDTTEMNEIHDLGAITYVVKAGDPQTSEGKTVNGEYIDIVHSRDYLVSSISFAVQKLFNRTDKVRFDNVGIAMIEGEVRTVLKRADLSGMIAHDDDGLPIYSTSFIPRSQVDPADREKRVYNGGTFEFELSGAIHQTKIKGIIKL
ncbi:DUF3383 family protein [Paenibacillus alvei]|uniref:DUF3383 family protein n=1 Tax=Paenibacillus alvei TaxID=44250 RepID=UPI002280C17E|nr:DUF3383 family protein [Paenibacillus alvei]MCY7484432.1 DUF3383 domain-containing protein [Paenibacillus alvei]